MPIVTKWTRLGPWAMSAIPKGPGVYELANPTFKTIFFGGCDNLDLRLHQHLFTKDPCLSRAWHFRYEEHPDPRQRLAELLDEYEKEQGELPDCQH